MNIIKFYFKICLSTKKVVFNSPNTYSYTLLKSQLFIDFLQIWFIPSFSCFDKFIGKNNQMTRLNVKVLHEMIVLLGSKRAVLEIFYSYY